MLGVDSQFLDKACQCIFRRMGFRSTSQSLAKLKVLINEIPLSQRNTWLENLFDNQSDNRLWCDIVEKLTVQETFFFRHPEQLDLISDYVLKPLIKEKIDQHQPLINLWSAGCSTGEEAYTLAILLVEALMAAKQARRDSDGRVVVDPKWQIYVLGTDISPFAVASSKKGVYTDVGMGAFRSLPEFYRKYFVETNQDKSDVKHYSVWQGLRDIVHIDRLNLLNSPPLIDKQDLILCRNVMIYFDQASKVQVLNLLVKSLTEGGALALGPSDVLARIKGLTPLVSETDVIYQKLMKVEPVKSGF